MMAYQKNNIPIVSLKYFFVSCILIALCSCSATKFLKENESLYTGAEVKLDPQGKVGGKKEVAEALEELLQPKPNFSILGARPRLWIYYKVGEPEKEKGLKHWLRNKVGEPPLLFSDVRPDRIQNTLQNELFNMGFFDAEVSYDIEKKEKTTSVDYIATFSAPYTIKEIVFPTDSSDLSAKIRVLEEETLLQTGKRFDLDELQEERQRIENALKDQGFYYFNTDHLIFETDSTVGDKEVNLYLKVKENIPPQALNIYKINKIDIYPDYSFAMAANRRLQPPVVEDSMNYYEENSMFRPQVITNSILLRRGEIYSRELHNKSLHRLTGLGTFKYVSMRFDDDSVNQWLNTRVYLTPLKKKSLRFQVELVSKSNNFLGPGVELTYTNRNLFRGAELLQVSLTSSFETQVSGQQNTPLNSFEIGLQGSLEIPRFITPFNLRSKYKYVPQTRIGAGVSVLNRVEYFRMRSFNFNYGFLWKEATTVRHELIPVDINFVKLTEQGPLFKPLLESNPFLARTYQDQFIIGGRYSFTYNSKLKEENQEKDNNFYINANVDIAGNLLHLLQSGVQEVESTDEQPYTIFGSPYAQYGKFQVDFRHFYRLDKKNQLAYRLIAGIGLPYGNSSFLPYIKQFSAGGSNSIRAFRARSVGPGTYYNDSINNSDVYIDQTGDIKLEGSLEYRFDIVGALKGAVFTDAGNIWLANEDSTRVGSKFDSKDFLEELAVGTGVGIRLDTDFFVLRLDVAFPVRKLVPLDASTSEGAATFEWVFDDIDFGSKSWRRENLVWNIAIGYPF